MNVSNSVVAVRAAIQFIKNNGLYFAGELVNKGHVGIYKATSGIATLVFLQEDKHEPLREVVKKTDGTYRVASYHFAGHVDGHKHATIEEAAAAYWDTFGGKIIGVIPFETLEAEMEVVANAVIKDTVVNAVLDAILLGKFEADAYKPFLHKDGGTHVLVRHNGMYAVYSTNYQDVVTEWNYPNLAVQVTTGDFAENMISLNEPVVEVVAEPEVSELILKKREINKRIVEAVVHAKGLIRDEHNNGRNMIQLSHVAIFGKPGHKEFVVALLDGKLFCLNHIELQEDKTAILSTYSVGGNIMNKEDDMADRIADYQDFDKNTLWDLVRVDGK
ncbi:hypothetical protein D3C81_1048220 [compost metagenome]